MAHPSKERLTPGASLRSVAPNDSLNRRPKTQQGLYTAHYMSMQFPEKLHETKPLPELRLLNKYKHVYAGKGGHYRPASSTMLAVNTYRSTSHLDKYQKRRIMELSKGIYDRTVRGDDSRRLSGHKNVQESQECLTAIKADQDSIKTTTQARVAQTKVQNNDCFNVTIQSEHSKKEAINVNNPFENQTRRVDNRDECETNGERSTDPSKNKTIESISIAVENHRNTVTSVSVGLGVVDNRATAVDTDFTPHNSNEPFKNNPGDGSSNEIRPLFVKDNLKADNSSLRGSEANPEHFSSVSSGAFTALQSKNGIEKSNVTSFAEETDSVKGTAEGTGVPSLSDCARTRRDLEHSDTHDYNVQVGRQRLKLRVLKERSFVTDSMSRKMGTSSRHWRRIEVQPMSQEALLAIQEAKQDKNSEDTAESTPSAGPARLPPLQLPSKDTVEPLQQGPMSSDNEHANSLVVRNPDDVEQLSDHIPVDSRERPKGFHKNKQSSLLRRQKLNERRCSHPAGHPAGIVDSSDGQLQFHQPQFEEIYPLGQGKRMSVAKFSTNLSGQIPPGRREERNLRFQNEYDRKMKLKDNRDMDADNGLGCIQQLGGSTPRRRSQDRQLNKPNTLRLSRSYPIFSDIEKENHLQDHERFRENDQPNVLHTFVSPFREKSFKITPAGWDERYVELRLRNNWDEDPPEPLPEEVKHQAVQKCSMWLMRYL